MFSPTKDWQWNSLWLQAGGEIPTNWATDSYISKFLYFHRIDKLFSPGDAMGMEELKASMCLQMHPHYQLQYWCIFPAEFSLPSG